MKCISDTICHCAAMYDDVKMADPFCLDCGGTGRVKRKLSLREKLIKERKDNGREKHNK